MKYRKLSWVGFLLAFFFVLAQWGDATSAVAGRSEPGAGGSNVEARVFIAGVLFGDLCARGGYTAVPAGGDRLSEQ
jgi:hypothetical protein